MRGLIDRVRAQGDGVETQTLRRRNWAGASVSNPDDVARQLSRSARGARTVLGTYTRGCRSRAGAGGARKEEREGSSRLASNDGAGRPRREMRA